MRGWLPSFQGAEVWGAAREIGVSESEAVEDVIAGSHHVEEPMVAVAIDHHLAIAGGLDRDRFVGRALQSKRHGSVERGHHWVHVIEAFGFIAAGMEQENVAPLSATCLAFASVALATEHLKQPVVTAAPDQAPLGVEIALTTPDVSALFQRTVKAGATAVSEPATKPWGQTVAYVRDNSGFLVELCTPMP